MARTTTWLMSLLLAAGSQAQTVVSTTVPGKPAFGIEVIVRTAQNFHRAQDVQRFVEQAAKNGVQTISLLVKQDEDGPIASGRAFYRSEIAPSARGYEQFDVLQAMLGAAHARPSAPAAACCSRMSAPAPSQGKSPGCSLKPSRPGG